MCLPTAASTIFDHTSARGRAEPVRPRARATCSRSCTDAPLDNASFPYMSARAIDVAYAPVLALRVTYLGELGYELHVPVEYALHLYEQLWSAGERHRDRQRRLPRRSTACGSRSTTLSGARTSRSDYNPYEAGLGFCVAPGKGEFLRARGAGRRQSARSEAQARVVHRAPRLNLFGGEIVLAGDRVLGRVTSGGYGYTVGRNIFCAYVAADEPGAAEYAIEVMGERHPALRHTRPLYDPDRSAILA